MHPPLVGYYCGQWDVVAQVGGLVRGGCSGEGRCWGWLLDRWCVGQPWAPFLGSAGSGQVCRVGWRGAQPSGCLSGACWGGLQPHDPEQVKRGRRSYCLRPFSALPGSCWRPVAKAGVRKAAPELELLPIWKRVWPKGPWSLELLGQACPSPEEAVVTSGRWGPLFLPGAEERPRRSLL